MYREIVWKRVFIISDDQNQKYFNDPYGETTGVHLSNKAGIREIKREYKKMDEIIYIITI